MVVYVLSFFLSNKPAYKEVHRPVPACKKVQAGRVGDLILNILWYSESSTCKIVSDTIIRNLNYFE